MLVHEQPWCAGAHRFTCRLIRMEVGCGEGSGGGLGFFVLSLPAF